jgi:autotransporter-associated beta strand protein
VPLSRYQATSSGNVSTGSVSLTLQGFSAINVMPIGSTGLITNGAGTLTLGGTNTYTPGSTTITGGTLTLDNSVTTTAGTLTLAGPGTFSSGTTLTLANLTAYTLASGQTFVISDPARLSDFDPLNLPPGATLIDGVLTIRPVSTDPIPPVAPAVPDTAPSAL